MTTKRAAAQTPPAAYPFTAIVGQEEMKLALLLTVVAPQIGGVLIMGERGTAKSTAVRALAELLPHLSRVRGCVFNCDPADVSSLCDDCAARREGEGQLEAENVSVPVVDLPLGATEDRVTGTIDLERALTEGVKSFEPGLLARAHRGFLYIDEVNLLEDHLVDLLLDAAATGRNRVEREGISIAHAARFVLVGSGNPEEGELRPQLLDRFGLYTEVQGVAETEARMEIVERREAFERDPARFLKAFAREQTVLRRRLASASGLFKAVEMPRPLLRSIVELCARLKVDGHRGELTITRAARALAALENRKSVNESDVRRVAPLALRHRLRRDPLEQTSSGARIQQTLDEVFGNKLDVPATAHDEAERNTQTGEGRADGDGLNGDGDANDGGARRKSPRGAERRMPTEEGRLPAVATEEAKERTQLQSARLSSNARQRRGRSRSVISERGRYARSLAAPNTTSAKIALDATLRAVAARLFAPAQTPALQTPRNVAASELRYKQLRRKSGTLFILAVDASGSMAVNRIGQVKGALSHLLRRSYVNRDRVALVSFRERRAELLLAPSRSGARARRLLDSLVTGGATPLAAGVACALEVAARAARQRVEKIVLLLFTDGRANVALGGEAGGGERASLRRQIRDELLCLGLSLKRAGVRAVVVDTQHRFMADAEGRELAAALGGRYVHLPSPVAAPSAAPLMSSMLDEL